MSAARRCFQDAIVACRQRAPAVLAVVMATEDSTYAPAGAVALFGADGAQQGWLSGGCLEPEIAYCAAAAAAAGELAWMTTLVEQRPRGAARAALADRAVACPRPARWTIVPTATRPW